MKATYCMAGLLLATILPSAYALESCPDCGSKELMIRQLEAELATLKGQPEESSVAAVTPVPEPTTAGSLTYTVQPGDGLMKIARKTNCKAADLASVNGLDLDSVIRVGQVLKLPASATTTAQIDPPKARIVEEAPKPRTYTLKEGDTYYSLSRRMGIPLDDLMAANPKAKATQLYAGRVINLPGPAAAEQAAQPAELASSTPVEEEVEEQPQPEPGTTRIVSVAVEEEISYADFASRHGTSVERLNSLNDLNLTSATILAKGSELYVPTQTAPTPPSSSLSVTAQP